MFSQSKLPLTVIGYYFAIPFSNCMRRIMYEIQSLASFVWKILLLDNVPNYRNLNTVELSKWKANNFVLRINLAGQY